MLMRMKQGKGQPSGHEMNHDMPLIRCHQTLETYTLSTRV